MYNTLYTTPLFHLFPAKHYTAFKSAVVVQLYVLLGQTGMNFIIITFVSDLFVVDFIDG